MRSSRSLLDALFVLAVALALVPVAQASIYAMADGVNFNNLAQQRAQKRAQQQQQQHRYRDLVRNPFRIFKRQEDNPGTVIPTLPPILNTSSTTTAPDTSATESSITTLDTTSTDDPSTTTAETTEPSETQTSTTDASSTATGEITSTTDSPSEETSSTSSDGPASETTDAPSTEETTTIRTTLNTSVKSAYTTAWSTSTYTLPNGAVGTVTEYLVVVPTISPTRPQEPETATGTASLHTNVAGLHTPGPVAPVVALMAVLGYAGGAAF